MIDPAHRNLLRRWLELCALLVALMVVVGGFVRLSRAGLSIVEWDVVMGVLPPMGAAAWQETFARYLASPEGQHVNAGMSLAAYQRIFYIEWIHRLLARAIGLVVALPLVWFLWRGIIPRGRRAAFVTIGLLYAFQGFLGWFMVASGLVDRPAVSHLRLTTHLLAALGLLALCLWLASTLRYADDPPSDGRRVASGPRRLGLAVLAIILLQIAWGGFVAGLKAGHVSNTWPLMFGRWIPLETMVGAGPAWLQAFENPITVHFLHRWLAFGVLAAVAWTWFRLRRPEPGVPAEARRASRLLLALVLVQVGLGIATVLSGVTLWIALAHQATAVAVFATAVFLNHRLLVGAR
jgi:cytochrome c oxidase assembly protein subunit 15